MLPGKEPKVKPKGIKKVSDNQDLVYAAKRLKFLKDNPRCEVYPHLQATEIHHDSGRLGSKYLDESTWHSVSREGHNWIHNNDSQARGKGFLKTRTN